MGIERYTIRYNLLRHCKDIEFRKRYYSLMKF